MPVSAAESAPERVFLGRDRPFLEAVADWLIGHFGAGQQGVVVALPGARAGQRLEELLAARTGPALRPPRVCTAGAAADAVLAPPGRPRASRMLRTLLWTECLRGAGAHRLRPLLPQPPRQDETAAWLAAGAFLRRLHAEVAAGGWRFAQVVEHVPDHQRPRWEVLAGLQQDFASHLAALGRHDPHLERMTAVAARRVRPPRALILAGVLELHGLERQALAAALAQAGPGHGFALVPTEAGEHAAFDAWGCVRPDAWPRDPGLDPDCWRIAEDPTAEADDVLEVLRSLDPPPAPEDVVAACPDEAVAATLAHRLDAAGVRWHAAAGRPFAATAPGRLLAGLAAFLARPHARELAALLRQADLEDALGRLDRACTALLPALDAWYEETVPGELDPALGETWQAPRSSTTRVLEAARSGLRSLLGPFLGAARMPLPAWAPPLRTLLQQLSPPTLDLDRPADWERHQALRRCLELLDDLEELPAGDPVQAAEALTLLLQAGTDSSVPTFPERSGLALTGWLELLHDDAPVVLLTGFQEGVLPAARPAHPFLPDALRQRLGLASDAGRLARDACALELLLHTPSASGPRRVWLFSARCDSSGDPLRPSRLAFACPAEDIPARMLRFLTGSPEPTAPGAADRPAAAPPAAPPPASLPADPSAPPLESVPVTAFRNWLDSPYLFYLRHVVGLEEVVEEPREMNARIFGSLAHEVLQGLGTDEAMAACDDPGRLAEFLLDRLHERFLDRFGRRPRAAVRLQRAILEQRLRVLADWQAADARNGWRIVRAEAPLPDACCLEAPDGEGRLRVRGRVDRVDRHQDGRWRILDYKTGENHDGPRRTHGPARGQAHRWKDLQLPLYGHFLGELLPAAAGAEVQLGYACLSRADDPGQVLQVADWSPEELAGALRTARDAVAGMLRGAWFEVGDWPQHEDGALAFLAGRGLLAGSADHREALP